MLMVTFISIKKSHRQPTNGIPSLGTCESGKKLHTLPAIDLYHPACEVDVIWRPLTVAKWTVKK